MTEGELPAHVRARASYGPEACAQAANLTCGHYIPVHRATVAAARLAGQPALEPAVLEDLLTRYRALTGAGLTANLYRRTATAKDARASPAGSASSRT